MCSYIVSFSVSSFPIPPGLRDGTSRHNRMLGPARQILREWFDAHDHRPFPSGTEKRYLARSSGLTLTQVFQLTLKVPYTKMIHAFCKRSTE